MTGFVTLIVLAAAAMHATWSALVKGQTDRLVGMAVMSGVGSLVGVGLIWLEPRVHSAALPWVIASIVLHWAYFAVLVEAYRIGDLSHVYPISRGSSPLGIALFGYVLGGDSLPRLVLLGVAAVSLGIFSLALPGADSRGEARGDSAAVAAPPRRSHWLPLAYALTIGGFIIAYSHVDSRGVRVSGSPLGYAGWMFAFQSVPWLLLAGVRRGRAIARVPRLELVRSLSAGVLSVSAYGAVLWAFSQGAAAPVSALRETGVIFAALIGTVFLGEPFGVRRVAASVLVALGVALIRLG